MFKWNTAIVKMTTPPAYFGTLAAALFLLSALLFLGFSSNSHAAEALEISLRSSSDSPHIGPYSFVTNRKPGSDYTETDIAQQHRDSLRQFAVGCIRRQVFARRIGLGNLVDE